ncbi:MAG: diguanylate cyclase [Desulfuromonadales bacterium]|nr:diguanylate cyclase [Desulfuromonadales bacterium]
MMNATALVLGTDQRKKLQLVQLLTTTQLFDRIKPLQTPTALFQHLKNGPADIVCWALDNEENKAGWVGKLSGYEQWHDLPVIAFADNQESLLNGFTLGASDSLKLSTDLNELSARLQGHLRRWQRLLDLRQSKEQLQKMALTDPLTELGNRTTFDMSIKQAAARTQRSGSPYSLLMIDLDHFKGFNDCYGHQAGDKVLKHVAEAIRNSAREADICCRYGGEEFVVILPDTDAKSAEVLANRIHKQVALVSRRLHLKQQPLTVSIGVSCADQKGSTHPTHLVEEADRALYQAKENGRNRTETWRPPSYPTSIDYGYMPTRELAFGT